MHRLAQLRMNKCPVYEFEGTTPARLTVIEWNRYFMKVSSFYEGLYIPGGWPDFLHQHGFGSSSSLSDSPSAGLAALK